MFSHVGRLRKLVPERYNSDLDKLTNPHHKKYLIELHSKVTKTIKFHSNRFALRNKSLSLMELVSKYSTSFLTGALKKAARKLSSKNNPPPPCGRPEKKKITFFPHWINFEILLQLLKTPKFLRP